MKRILLMFGMIACWMSSAGQLTMAYSDTVCGSGAGSTSVITIQNPLPASQDVKLVFWAQGDLNSSGEQVDVFTENGYQLGVVTNPIQCGTYDSVSFTVPVDSFNAWGLDGSITFSNYFTPTTGFCAPNECIYVIAEYIPVTGPNNAGVMSLDSPRAFCSGTEPIYISIVNSGTNIIDSVRVNWSLNGVVQPIINYTSPLDTLGGLGASSAQVFLGNHNFVANTATDIKAWTSMPNGVADTSNTNDTISKTLSPALSGVYTINDAQPTGGSNFNTFGAAFGVFSSSGVCGPVVLNVSGGPYYEKLDVKNFAGSSSINTITINGNGASIVDSGNTGGNHAIVMLDGADYVVIDSLNIRGYASSNQFGLQFMNGADNNIIRNCKIELRTDVTTSLVSNVVFSSSVTSPTSYGNTGNYNLIENNEIIGGYYGIAHGGTSPTVLGTGNQFIGNIVKDFYYYGMRNYYQEDVVIRDNEFTRITRPTFTTGYAMYNGYTVGNTEISGNWIHHMFGQATSTSNTSTLYGIYSFSSDAAGGDEVKVFNNVLSDNNNGGTHYMIYNSASDNWKYYHNTIVEEDPNGSGTGITRGIYHTGTVTGVEYKNNLIYVDRGTSGLNYAIYTTVNTGATFDGNVLYMPQAGTGNNHYAYYTANQTTFADWQAAGSAVFDQNGISANPFFANAAMGDYTPGSAVMNNTGLNLLTEVSTDILGVARTATPDAGAYEFTPPPGPNMTVLSMSQNGAVCGTGGEVVYELTNMGNDTVTSFNVSWEINGVAQTPIAYSGIFNSGVQIIDTIKNITLAAGSTQVKIDITGIAPGVDTDLTNNADSVVLNAGLNGNYYIVSGFTNDSTFTSFSALATALTNYGVCGPVSVDVANAVSYTEQFMVGEIIGVSATNTITINGNGNTLEYQATNSGLRATVILNGADWITIDSLNIVALGASYGFGVSLTNNADHNTISKCNVSVEDGSTSSVFAGITVSGSLSSATGQGASGNYNTFEDNTVTGGYYGMTSVGVSTDSLNGNVFRNNVVSDYYYYGMYNYYNDHIVLEGNEFSRMNRAANSSHYFMYNYGSTSAHIIGNKMHDPVPLNTTTTSGVYGMYLGQVVGTPSDPSIVANNMLYNMNSAGTQYGVYTSTISNTKIINNTWVFDDPSNTGTTALTRGWYMIGSITNCEISNNITYFNRNAGGVSVMIYCSTQPSGSNFENNAYYLHPAASADFGYLGGATPTFGAWQMALGGDQNSQISNPYFVDPSIDDFTPQSAMLNASGVDFSMYNTVDIDGAVRGTKPDIGAIEFVPAPCTGLSGITSLNVTATGGTVAWLQNPAAATIEWGPVGYRQASQAPTGTATKLATDSSHAISGLNSNTCYEYWLTMNCSSSLPGAPPLMGPFTFCTDCAGGPLNGTYTIGGTPGLTNFPTLDSAVQALNGCGIGGPVIFNMNGGTHNAIMLEDIQGSSAVNTITFNGSTTATDSIVAVSQAAAVDLNGTGNITFNDIFMANTSGNYVVWFHNNAHNITIDECYLLGNGTATSSVTAVVAASGSATTTSSSGNNANNVTISNCTISGNYNGISFYGSGSTSFIKNINIIDNNFVNQYYYAVRAYYCDSLTVTGNYVPGFRNGFSYGLYSYYSNNVNFSENEMYDCGTYAVYMAYSNYSSATTTGSNSKVVNNMLQCTGTAGLYVIGNNDLDVYHNSIENTGSYSLYFTGTSSNIDVRNNILSQLSAAGDAIYVATVPTSFTVNYNLYSSAGDIAYYSGTAYATLGAWTTATPALNANSVVGSPGFISIGDFHTVSTDANDVGDNSVGVLVDIDGDPRPLNVAGIVDMGADEFNPPSCDRPDSLYVVSSSPTAIVVGWSGGSTAANYDVSAGVGGYTLGLPANITTGVLTNTYTISNPVANVIYDVYVRGNCTVTDSSLWSDKLSVGLQQQPCDDFEGYEVRNLQGQSNLVYGWANVGGDGEISTTYANSGTKSLHVSELGASNFTDMVVVTDTSYQSGIRNLQFDMFVPLGYGGYYNILHNYTGVTNVWAIEVYIDANGTAAVQGGTNSTANLGSYTMNPGTWNTIEHIIDLDNDTAWIRLNGATTPIGWQFSFGSTNMGDRFNAVNFYSAANAGQTSNYYVDNFCITHYTPPVCLTPSNVLVPNLKRGCDSVQVSWTSAIDSATSSIIEYGPTGFTPGTGTMVGLLDSSYNISGLVANTSYDLYVADTCSGGDTSVWVGPIIFITDPAPVASASFTMSSTFTQTTQLVTFDASASLNGDTYTWDFGNGNVGTGATPPVETYNLPNGSISVKLTVTNACGSSDDTTITFQTEIGLDEPEFGKTLSIYPNPSKGLFNIEFNKASGGEVSLEVLNTTGQVVYSYELGKQGGLIQRQINLSDLADGVYMLRIQTDLGIVTRRLNKM